LSAQTYSNLPQIKERKKGIQISLVGKEKKKSYLIA
jgi:hypothetical protein